MSMRRPLRESLVSVPLIRFAITWCFCLAPVSATAAVDTPDLPAFLEIANSVFTGKSDDFKSYIALHADYRALTPADRQQAGQVLSMIDAMFGRYGDARRHYDDTFPAKAALECPSSPFVQTPAESSLASVARASRVLLINESHSKVQTRAAIIRLLPVLRRAGYTDLALEALDPSGPVALRGAAGMRRGDLRDDIKSGFYLREPVYARMVEDAQGLGFGLVAYEGDSADRESRETKQATNLRRWLDAHPNARLVVVGGYSHIWKNDGWMAQKLAASLGQAIVSVDQIDGATGCDGQKARAAPSLWISPSQQAWSSHPERVDATLTWRSSDRRDNATAWLSLDGSRKRVPIPDACHQVRPCLVEARADDAPESVPEDRLVTFVASEKVVLYLTPGKYVLVERTTTGMARNKLDVRADGRVVRTAAP